MKCISHCLKCYSSINFVRFLLFRHGWFSGKLLSGRTVRGNLTNTKAKFFLHIKFSKILINLYFVTLWHKSSKNRIIVSKRITNRFKFFKIWINKCISTIRRHRKIYLYILHVLNLAFLDFWWDMIFIKQAFNFSIEVCQHHIPLPEKVCVCLFGRCAQVLGEWRNFVIQLGYIAGWWASLEECCMQKIQTPSDPLEEIRKR